MVGDFTASVLRLVTSPYLCFAEAFVYLSGVISATPLGLLFTELAILTRTDHPTSSLANTAHFRSCQENLTVMINLREERTKWTSLHEVSPPLVLIVVQGNR